MQVLFVYWGDWENRYKSEEAREEKKLDRVTNTSHVREAMLTPRNMVFIPLKRFDMKYLDTEREY